MLLYKAKKRSARGLVHDGKASRMPGISMNKRQKMTLEFT